jgi:hypothetical protein
MPINFNRSRMIRTHDTSPVLELIDAYNLRKAEQEPVRKYVGASAIGDSCERQIQFGYMGVPPDSDWKENPRFVRIRERGHLIEEMAIDWLTGAGFKMRPIPEGKQLRFVAAEGEFSGGCDGVIEDGPLDLPYPFLWEHKAVGGKSWRLMDRRGVRKGKPVYAGQVATYQAYLELGNPCLFQATNCDTMEIYFEWVEFDADLAQKCSDRAVDIILDTRAGILRPRISNDPDVFACRFCKWRKNCHSLTE